MTDVFLLSKIQLLGLFGINKLIHTKDARTGLKAMGMGIVFLILGAEAVFFSYMISAGYAAIGLVELVPAIFLLLFSLITLVYTLIHSSTTLFGFSDFDIIMSLPVSKSSVIMSRLLTVYLGNLVFGGVVLLPAMVVFMNVTGSPAILWLSALLIWLLAPLLPMIVSMFIGVVITAISIRFRHKNLVITLLSLIATLGTLALSFSIQSMDMDLLADLGLQLGNAIRHLYPPAALVTAALWKRSALALTGFALLSITASALFVFLLSKVYTNINSALFTQHTRSAYRVTQLNAADPNKALYRRELKLLTSYPVYLLNTCFGSVMMVGSILLLKVFGSRQLSDLLELPGLSEMLQRMAPFFPAIFVTMSSTTAASLNMEGKNRWILNSLPVSTKSVFDSKIMVNLTVLLPAFLFSSLILSMTFPFDFINVLMIFITPTVYAVFIAVVGLSINLRFLKYDWKSPQEAVKQSMSVMVTMLIGFAAIAAPVALGLSLPQWNQSITVAATLILAAITVGLYRSLGRFSTKKFLG